MKKFKVYLFDFDGTLVNSQYSLEHVFIKAYASIGVKIDKSIVLRLMRIPLAVGYEELNAPRDEESVKKFSRTILSCLDEEETIQRTKIFADTISTLTALKKSDVRLGIVTSNNTKHVNDVLSFLNIDRSLFSVIIGNNSVAYEKPHPEPILKALELLKYEGDLKEAAYIGDALMDVETASRSGVTPILLDRNNEYTPNDSPIIIHKLGELL